MIRPNASCTNRFSGHQPTTNRAPNKSTKDASGQHKQEHCTRKCSSPEPAAAETGSTRPNGHKRSASSTDICAEMNRTPPAPQPRMPRTLGTLAPLESPIRPRIREHEELSAQGGWNHASLDPRSHEETILGTDGLRY
ncbi:hypothetical protein V500_02633 [Pseudogymnoascus sp. VKM F-4518 (FW-2643)]|nr:hypothetical protein V500_02633 [Pseudogymnoascus sp. VKM F-4518 (FW-2643)]